MKKRSGTHPLLPVGMTCERAETIGCTGCTATCPAEEAAMAAKPAQDFRIGFKASAYGGQLQGILQAFESHAFN